ncbi:GGDEF domain-containing protein [Phenylobacterium immobile]|uniref:GGDEF domain-containing protein n=1 Tax=Phenylobacterium immobile TaxID=21 RepID=UPI000A484840|nr:GGDEF domain-containing protein [Phenylobacterium immobile]
MSGLLVLLAQGTIFFVAMAAIFRSRKTIGIGVFFCVLGAMHFLETYLAAVFFIELPFGLISPGSTVMFAGKLAFFLLLYMKEDAESMRQPVYGLLGGNVLMVILALILRLHTPAAEMPGFNPDLRFLDQMGVLMVWGTALLFVDLIAMVLLFERLSQGKGLAVPLKIFISLAVVLSCDQAFFYAGLRVISGVPISAFYGGWIAKVGAAAFFTLMLSLYLRFARDVGLPARPHGMGDVFDRLTYRRRYEQLVEMVGKDTLTGLDDRGRFDTAGPQALLAAARAGQAVSLMMIDIDQFKAVNDRYGHPVGDQIIREVAAAIAGVTRSEGMLFRYGGDEFALMTRLSPTDAAPVGERVRAAVAAADYDAVDRPVTVSIGLAGFPADAADFASLLMRADAALYEAKARGRNQVALAADDAV